MEKFQVAVQGKGANLHGPYGWCNVEKFQVAVQGRGADLHVPYGWCNVEKFQVAAACAAEFTAGAT